MREQPARSRLHRMENKLGSDMELLLRLLRERLGSATSAPDPSVSSGYAPRTGSAKPLTNHRDAHKSQELQVSGGNSLAF